MKLVFFWPKPFFQSSNLLKHCHLRYAPQCRISSLVVQQRKGSGSGRRKDKALLVRASCCCGATEFISIMSQQKCNGEEQKGNGDVEGHKGIVESYVGIEKPADSDSAEKDANLDMAAEGLKGTRTEHQEESKPLSKNAQKKLLKMERYKAQKMQRKAFEKSKRHEETERKRKEWEVKLASLSVEDQEMALKDKMEKRMTRKEKWNDRKSRLRQGMESGQNLVIDLGFCDCMKPNELASLVQQVMYSYAANAKAVVPVRFSLTGCTGEILGHLSRVSGFSNWLVHKEERSYLEVFQERKEDLVYLTADSDCLIDQLEDSKIYIIGGLVDRNRWKGLTLEKARSQGIASAKLPITEHLKMISSVVLTVNQVVEIILHFLQLKNWEAAFRQVIPLRKRSGEDIYDDTQSKIPHHEAESFEKDGSQHPCDDV